MTTATRSRRPVQPVSGSCRWLRRLILNTGRPGLVSITSLTQAGPVTSRYEVTAHMIGPDVIGYRLQKLDGNREVYDVLVEGNTLSCDCRDYLTRRDPSLGLDPSGKGCKHCCCRSFHGKLSRLI